MEIHREKMMFYPGKFVQLSHREGIQVQVACGKYGAQYLLNGPNREHAAILVSLEHRVHREVEHRMPGTTHQIIVQGGPIHGCAARWVLTARDAPYGQDDTDDGTRRSGMDSLNVAHIEPTFLVQTLQDTIESESVNDAGGQDQMAYIWGHGRGRHDLQNPDIFIVRGLR